MALARVYCRAQLGMDSPLVSVEVHISNGLPSLSIVGLPETAVKESKDRVRSAIINSGFEFPVKRITINLAPADLSKEGGRFDLPIAIAILIASKQIEVKQIDQYELCAELSLSGKLRPIQGILPFAIHCIKAKRKLICAGQNLAELAILKPLKAYCANDLQQVTLYLTKTQLLKQITIIKPEHTPNVLADLSDIKGQFEAKRAFSIAAAGGHNLLFIEPPGAGKTMLASRLPTILPIMSTTQAVETAAIYSIKGSTDQRQFYQRPFRSPHHSASAVSLVGGGSNPKPGEISLTHNGVLFLDELPEFDRHVSLKY